MSNKNSCPQCKANIENSFTSVQNCNYCHTLLVHANGEFSSIKCKGCSAPLKLEGELSQSKVLVCGYCHTAMESEHEFKVLYSFSNIQKPNSSLEVGMRGTIEEIEFTIVSLIVYKSRGTEWLEFMLYSVEKGYLKLLKKDGRYLLLRATMEALKENIWLLKKGDSFQVEEKSFVIDEFLFSEIYYAQGNIDSKINQKQRNKQCFAKSGDYWLHSIYSKEQVEYYLGREIEDVETLFC